MCGVAIREEGAVLVADGCMGGNSPVFLSLPFTQLKKGFRVHVDDSDGKVFQVGLHVCSSVLCLFVLCLYLSRLFV